MAEIVDVHAREILDSRGNPTLEVEVHLDSGAEGRAAVPSGASTGSAEALELRDDDRRRFGGKGVLQAVRNVERVIAPEVKGMDAAEQALIDRALCQLDGTPQKETLGANAILGVSLACARAAADDLGIPLFRYLGGPNARTLPLPLMNVINGGAHADNRLDIQEFMLVPAGLPSFAEALRAGSEIFHALKRLLREQKHVTGVGDEGGFAPDLPGAEAALGVLVRAIEAAGYRPGEDVWLALDVAATELWREGRYQAPGEGATWATGELIAFYERLADRFPLVSIEDGLREDDWDGWTELTRAARRPAPARRRRPLRDERGPSRGGDPARGRQRDPDQGEPDRHLDGDARRRRAGEVSGLRGRRLPPLRGDRGYLHRGPRRRRQRGPDQDRVPLPERPRRQVQPAPADRGVARRDRPLAGHDHPPGAPLMRRHRAPRRPATDDA